MAQPRRMPHNAGYVCSCSPNIFYPSGFLASGLALAVARCARGRIAAAVRGAYPGGGRLVGRGLFLESVGCRAAPRCGAVARRRSGGEWRQPAACQLCRQGSRAGAANRHDANLSHHGARAGRKRRSRAAGVSQGGKRYVSAARRIARAGCGGRYNAKCSQQSSGGCIRRRCGLSNGS